MQRLRQHTPCISGRRSLSLFWFPALLVPLPNHHSRLLHDRITTTTTTLTHQHQHRHYVFRRAFSTSIARAERQHQAGTTTQTSTKNGDKSRSPFYFEAGYALYAKRVSRPFPPPFLSQPSGSFSDPLSTHDRSRDRRQEYDGQLIRGVTNGDDAVLVSDNLICANDGVGAWAQKERGHAALWSRLVAHFWALEAENDAYGEASEPTPVQYLQRAYERTKEATTHPNALFGTTTASGALLTADSTDPSSPVLYVTQIGDSQVLVIRPDPEELTDTATTEDSNKKKEEEDTAADANAAAAAAKKETQSFASVIRSSLSSATKKDDSSAKDNAPAGKVIYKTKEQWHWFDCPRQLGTNSPDTPETDAVLDKVPVREGDIILAMSDGVTDNLWEHEVVASVMASFRRRAAFPRADDADFATKDGSAGTSNMAKNMEMVATDLMEAAKKIALDGYAESPFMERAIDEGLAAEGGKLDDISVVAALCMRRKG